MLHRWPLFTCFFAAKRSGNYNPGLTTIERTGATSKDATEFRPVNVYPDYKSMSPLQQSHMVPRAYDTSHEHSGLPGRNPGIYSDLLAAARRVRAPYPAGVLDPAKRQKPTGTVIIAEP
jgi:hypothetical protein